MLNQVWVRGWERCLNSPALRRWSVRHWYEFLSVLDYDGSIRLMNYGYADDAPLCLTPDDEPQRYAIQLYHHVATQVDLRELDVLEVGSGRGGGAYYVMRYLKPREYTGVELAARAVAFCHKQYRLPGLYFFQGDAEHLEFRDATFDIVLNIESSSHYGDIEAFFAQVKRVLRPGGFFLYADTWTLGQIPLLYKHLDRVGLTAVSIRDIRPQVLNAMDADDECRNSLSRKYTPKFLRGAMKEFAGTRGSEKFEMFRQGKLHYLCCLVQKPQGTQAHESEAGGDVTMQHLPLPSAFLTE